MRFRVHGPGWPVAGALLIGDIDTDLLPWLQGLTPPQNSIPLDEAAYYAMAAAYSGHLSPPPPAKTPTKTANKER
jgi:hypothetical protein